MNERLRFWAFTVTILSGLHLQPDAKAADIFSLAGTGLDVISSAAEADYLNSAFSFRTLSDKIELTSYTLTMSVDSDPLDAMIFVYENDSLNEVPSSTLVAFGSSTVSNTSYQEIAFELNSISDLQAESVYWIVLYVENAGKIINVWYEPLVGSTKSEPYATMIGDFAYADFESPAPPFSNWTRFEFEPGGAFFAGKLEGNIIPVPEPSAWVFACVAAAGCFIRIRATGRRTPFRFRPEFD